MLSPFKQYLKLSKRWFEIQKNKKFGDVKNINIVIGNESADLDSTIGSMIYAYYKFCKIIKEFEQKDVENILNFFIPIIQCSRSDIASRFESIDLFEANQIDCNDILFIDEFNINDITSSTQLNVTLYDHNCTIYPALKDKVVDIVDHHKDLTSEFYEKQQIITKNIKTIGSGTSLLGEYFMNGNEDILDSVVADSILKTIIVDSYNFDPKLENTRWNQRDMSVYNYMSEYLKKVCPEKSIDRNIIFQHFEGLKFNPKNNLNLGITKLFIKDYKQFTYSNNTQVGYCVFMIPPESFFEAYKTQFLEQEIQSFILQRSLDFLFLMFAFFKNDIFQRTDIVIAQQNRIQDLNLIKEQLNSKLKIQFIDFTNNWNIYKNHQFSFYDITHAHTRKTIEPLISEIPFSKQ